MRWFVLLTLLLCAACGDDRTAAPPPRVDPTAPSTSRNSATGRVTARIVGLRNDQGRVIARLYRGGTGFPSKAEAAFRRETFPIRAGVAEVSFPNLPYGEYALWICHDEDGNGKLNTNFLGMPREGVGVSGPPPSFIPSYGDARFALDRATSEHEIKIKYL